MVDILQYAIVRFRPFPETGEFANVGIILFDRPRSVLRYKIVPRRFRRVSQFFNLSNPDLFWNAVTFLQEELDRLVVAMRHQPSTLLDHFLQRGKESVWIFSNLRTLSRRDESDDVIDALYERYVGRNFANVEYQEQLMVRTVRHWLKRRNIQGFTERMIDDELVPMKLPLVSESNGVHVIKPISLNRKTTLGIIDHAATWHDRFELLIDRGRLQRDNILLPIAPPDDVTSPLYEAFESATAGLSRLGVHMLRHDDFDAIVQFARKGASRTASDLYH